MTRARGIFIGAGFFAQFQAEAWKRLPEAEITAVVDAIPGKAQAFADRFGIARAYTSADEALKQERPEFVDIATRPESHLELTWLAASQGAHVICQKPMAPTMAECVAMCEACESAGVRLLIHENWRWQPWNRELKRRLDRGEIGRVFQLSFFWRTGDGAGPAPYPTQPYFRQMPRLLVYETLVHLLDTFRFLAGPCQVTHSHLARINPVIVGEDHAIIHLRFDSGAIGLIDGNRFTGPVPAPVAMGQLLVEGERGLLRVAPTGTLHFQPAGGTEVQLPFQPIESGYKGDSVLATQQHLLACLRDNRPAESEGRDYLKTVALVDACYERSKQTMVS